MCWLWLPSTVGMDAVLTSGVSGGGREEGAIFSVAGRDIRAELRLWVDAALFAATALWWNASLVVRISFALCLLMLGCPE